MADYQLTDRTAVIRTADRHEIPSDPGNRDWVAYQAWLAAGNVPDPYIVPPAPIPSPVSRMQAMVAMSRAGLLTSVQNWITTQDAETQLIWNTATDFSRSSTLLNNAATALNLTSAQVDQLFITAATIVP